MDSDDSMDIDVIDIFDSDEDTLQYTLSDFEELANAGEAMPEIEDANMAVAGGSKEEKHKEDGESEVGGQKEELEKKVDTKRKRNDEENAVGAENAVAAENAGGAENAVGAENAGEGNVIGEEDEVVVLEAGSSGNDISSVTDAEMSEHLEMCMRLAAEDQITPENAFDLHLIDYMPRLLQRDQKLASFHNKALVVGVSTHIYSERVDKVYEDTIRLQKICENINKDRMLPYNDDRPPSPLLMVPRCTFPFPVPYYPPEGEEEDAPPPDENAEIPIDLPDRPEPSPKPSGSKDTEEFPEPSSVESPLLIDITSEFGNPFVVDLTKKNNDGDDDDNREPQPCCSKSISEHRFIPSRKSSKKRATKRKRLDKDKIKKEIAKIVLKQIQDKAIKSPAGGYAREQTIEIRFSMVKTMLKQSLRGNAYLLTDTLANEALLEAEDTYYFINLKKDMRRDEYIIYYEM